MTKIISSLLALWLFGCAGHVQAAEVGSPLDHCHFRITKHPSWLVTVYKGSWVPVCEYQITNGTPSPTYPCAWVISFNTDDTYRIVADSNYGGGQCIEPLVLCVSGDCP